MTNIKNHLNQVLKTHITEIKPLGSSLNQTFKANTSQLSLFIKWQENPNDMLIKEADELRLLGKFIPAPKVIHGDENCLILEWLEADNKPLNQVLLATKLAHLHQQTDPYFGFKFDNKIGITPQSNAVGQKITNWHDFYLNHRLLPQISLAKNSQLLPKKTHQDLIKLTTKIPDLLPKSPTPSLCHGDLWQGNIINHNQTPYFIDPACYYGDPASDLALAQMFGGFSADFYQTYYKSHPKASNSAQIIYQLYHYLNHLNLFGTSYLNSIHSCLNKL